MKQLPYQVIFSSFFIFIFLCLCSNTLLYFHVERYSRLVILSIGTLDKMIPAVRGSPVCCRVLSIIPGFYPRDIVTLAAPQL